MKIERMKIGSVLLMIMMTAFLLTGCGNSSSKYNMDTAAGAGPNGMKAGNTASYSSISSMPDSMSDDLYAAETESVTEETAAAADSGTSEAAQTASPVTDDRKLIKTVRMEAETEAYDTLLANVQKKINLMGGYISNLSSGENGYGNETRYATIVAKVPAEKVDQFVTEVSDISNVISKNETVEDITLQYVDLESHKKALLTEQESLLKLMEDANAMEDIIAIESRLSEVRYQLESMESQLRTFDNQVAYSEVSLYITEVTRLTPMEEVGTWDKISEGFMDNVDRVGKGIKNFFIQLIINLPIIFVIAVIGLIIYLIIRFVEKRSKKQRDKILAQRKEARESQSLQQSQAQQPQTQQSQVQQSQAQKPHAQQFPTQQTVQSTGAQSYDAYVEQRDRDQNKEQRDKEQNKD